MNIRGIFILAAALAATHVTAANAPPLAGEWNILPTGNAASSGDLLFRVTPGDGGDPVEVEVPVIAGSSDRAIASSIRRAFDAQLPYDRYRVAQGEGTNILVSDPRGRPNFSVELVDSDVDNLRVAVRSVSPAASPTVPQQAQPVPAPNITPPLPETPPGDALPPPDARSPRPPPNDMPIPGESPVPGPDGIPLPTPNTPAPSPTIPMPPRDESRLPPADPGPPPPSKPRL